MIDFKMVPLGEIVPDPNQPRQMYDVAAMQELTDSVREKGILQPVLIRPIGNSEAYVPTDFASPTVYLIVCGERRYRAALAVNGAIQTRDTIPCIIRELSDEEALEIQIVENLQRKDVHPMEEAVAFKSLIEKGKDIKEVAARVGKTEYYAKQRLKLCDLSNEWQKAFYGGRIQHKDALKLATFDKATQNELWKDEAQQKGEINLNNYTLNRYTGSLHKATFDLADALLIKKAGACISCPFNSAVQSLFPDAEKEPRCTKTSCFKSKTDKQFALSLAKAKEEPGMLFVNTSYYEHQDDLTRQLDKEGYTYLNGVGKNNYNLVVKPVRPDLSDYDSEDYGSEQEMQAEFAEEVRKYEGRLNKYNDHVEGGNYKKGFVVHGDEIGEFVFLQVGKAAQPATTTAQKTKEKEKAGKLTTADIDSEIKRLKDGEIRKKELDLNKVHLETLRALDAVKAVKEPGLAHQGLLDRSMMIFCLLRIAGYGAQNIISKKLKSLPKEPTPRAGYSIEYFHKLGELSDDDLAFIVRAIAIDKWGSVNFQGNVHFDDTIIRIMAEYAGVDLKAIETAQAEVAAKRILRVDARISELQRKKADIKQAGKKKETAKQKK